MVGPKVTRPERAWGMKFSQPHFSSHSKHITRREGRLIKDPGARTHFSVFMGEGEERDARGSIIDSQFKHSRLRLLCLIAAFLYSSLPLPGRKTQAAL